MAWFGVHVSLPFSPCPAWYCFRAKRMLNGWTRASLRLFSFLSMSQTLVAPSDNGASTPMLVILPRFLIIAVIGIFSNRAFQIYTTKGELLNNICSYVIIIPTQFSLFVNENLSPVMCKGKISWQFENFKISKDLYDKPLNHDLVAKVVFTIQK